MEPCSLKPYIYLSWLKPKVTNIPKYEIKDNNAKCLTSIGPYKSIYGDVVLVPNGLYYWEIQIEKGHYFKIGIAEADLIDDSNLGAFSDSKKGFAYFSMEGSLRNGTNTFSNKKFSNPFGMGDLIGVYFDSINGFLKFYLNGKDCGIAFKNQIFKEKTYRPAVACLRKGEVFSLKINEKED